MSVCGFCNKKLTLGSGHIIACIVCRNFFHATQECTALTASEVRVAEMKSKSLLYKCVDCTNEKKTCCSETLLGIKDDISIIKESCSAIDAMAKDIKDLQVSVSSIPDMKKDIDDLKKDLSNVKTNNVNNEEIINELQDRIQRSRNIILFNVLEVKAHVDSELAKRILKDIPVSTSNITTKRIGQAKEGAVRPLIITMNSTSDAHLVIKNKNKLDKKIKVSLDKTKSQREQYTAVVDELKKKLDEGESDLVVRYINNKPTVTKRSASAHSTEVIVNSQVSKNGN
ncbi:hypothetical protein QAD02_007277 [Eretmocerus hayati]|uniref:Uncharacterized protein n=1 Tax=Eretmocerus hayati TaxID=131215 RepID=A0ACC2N371_9HYME|nr:hypothetical protein QAD02_007277 [Eretmocerus hayati]